MNSEHSLAHDPPEELTNPEEDTAPNQDERDLLISALTDERNVLKDQLLRVMAEAQNVQRRLRQQMEDDRKFAVQPLVEKLLPVLDNFERSLASADKGASVESLMDGFRAIERQFRQALESASVHRVPAVGANYDPEIHEALVVLETDDHPSDTVVDEIESGYTLHGRVVRPAKVRVAKRP
ncbi:MAG: nucleotide exchange factor GrpE [Chthonomonadaceae bacterium]|jgi:molecular chaperone GrpE|nr:nucleotide exchange factor GrpE [Chthonomonadaceae bacterium]